MVIAIDILHVRDEKATTVNGGTNAASSDTIRVLNTVRTNEIAGASLGSNQITLPAGTYFIDAWATMVNVTPHCLVFYNVTDAGYEVLGISMYQNGSWGTEVGLVRGVFTITAEKVFELRHWSTTSRASTGLGRATSDGTIEVYADVVIEKLA